jgi:hypothetical protein
MNRYAGEDLFVPDLVRDLSPFSIVDARFDDCHLSGPAVVVLNGQTVMVNSHISAPIPDFVQALEIGETVPYGAIEMRNCEFYDCRLDGIGFLGSTDTVTALLADMIGNVEWVDPPDLSC